MLEMGGPSIYKPKVAQPIKKLYKGCEGGQAMENEQSLTTTNDGVGNVDQLNAWESLSRVSTTTFILGRRSGELAVHASAK
mgnify:FL=1